MYQRFCGLLCFGLLLVLAGCGSPRANTQDGGLGLGSAEQIFSGEVSLTSSGGVAEGSLINKDSSLRSEGQMVITGQLAIELDTSSSFGAEGEESSEEELLGLQVQTQATDTTPPTCTASYEPDPWTSGEVLVTLTCSEPVEFCGSDYADCPQPAPSNRPNWPVAGSACATAPDITYNGITIMACNIGATRVATSLTDTAAYGYYFQRGNNYGFWNGISGQTDQDGKASINIASTNARVNAPGYGPENYYFSNVFIPITNSPLDRDSSDNRNRRGGFNDTASTNGTGTYIDRQGPCPTGYHIPSTLEWKTLLEGNNPYNFFSVLKMPLAGLRSRNDASVGYQNGFGHYWSSSSYFDTASAYYLYFQSSYVNSQHTAVRAYGHSIRCFKNN